jgi:hypothetical protein
MAKIAGKTNTAAKRPKGKGTLGRIKGRSGVISGSAHRGIDYIKRII